MTRTAVKICGLRTAADARTVNEELPEYAGFVFHAKSSRNLSVGEARAIMEELSPEIRRVAVCVSPTPERAREILSLPFDIIQIHGTLTPETAEVIGIPVWKAVNIDSVSAFTGETDGQAAMAQADAALFAQIGISLPAAGKVTGILIDAKNYGSGKTFDWNAASQIRRAARQVCAAIDRVREERDGVNVVGSGSAERTARDSEARTAKNTGPAGERGEKTKFILAGGLYAENAAEGIRLFAPDAVDVSSGVEFDGGGVRRGEDGVLRGKDPRKVASFIRIVRGDAPQRD